MVIPIYVLPSTAYKCSLKLFILCSALCLFLQPYHYASPEVHTLCDAVTMQMFLQDRRSWKVLCSDSTSGGRSL